MNLWLGIALGVVLIAGITYVLIEFQRGIRSKPKLDQKQKDLEHAQSALELQQRGGVSPGVLQRVLRKRMGKKGN